MKMLKVAFIILCTLGLVGCPFGCPDPGCLVNFTFAGAIVDGLGAPVTGVGVYVVYPDGFEHIVDMTDVNGEFSYSIDHYYGRMAEASFSYRKIGYADYLTEPLGNGDGTCGDQVIVRDAIMTP